jgi:DNA-binding CsgD family transcriptional regulator
VTRSRRRTLDTEWFARATVVLGAETAALRALADSVPVGLVWLSQEGSLVGANRMAHDVAARTRAFSLTAGSLQWHDRDHAALANQCIAKALAGQPGSVVLSVRAKIALVLSAKYVTLPPAPLVPSEHRIALHVVPVAVPGPFPVQVLQTLYGLTPSESRLAYALAARRNLSEAAHDAGLTVTTARGYLKRVFLKTGTSRQAQLVRLLWAQNMPDGRLRARAER